MVEEEQRLVKVEVEEGEIWDSASVEEISEEDFSTKQAPATSPANNSGGGRGSGARVWTMRDMQKYQIASKTSFSGLYNLAWAQAVNNKPFFVMMEDGTNPNSDDDKIVIDVDEEGELEEGEIDLDSDLDVGLVKEDVGGDVDERERSRRAGLVKEELKNLNLAIDEKSYEGLCSSFETAAASLQEIVSAGSFPEKDALVQLLLDGIHTLNLVFSSMTLPLKEQNKAFLSRLVAQVTNLKPPLFSSLQLKEVEAIRVSLVSLDSPSNTNGNNDPADPKKCGIESGFTGSFDQTPNSFPVRHSNIGIVNSRLKGAALPLLDLHKDHDIDSLPSPTRDNSTPLPFEPGMVKPEWPVPRRTPDREDPMMHPYVTDAVKAVSSYQHKFGQNSYFMHDNLPSPTPSEDGDAAVEDVEINGEVSSSVIPKADPAAANTSFSGLPVSSSPAVMATPPFGNPLVKSSSAKSRDPRLRLANLDAAAGTPRSQSASTVRSDNSKLEPLGVSMNSRKQKTADEQVSNGPALKRQRNEPNAITYSTATTLPVSFPHTTSPLTSQSENLPVKNSNATASLQSLLQEIAGNPSEWVDFLIKENLKSSDDNKGITKMSNSISSPGGVPSMHGQKSSEAIVQTPSQAVSVEEPGKVRMKPRDPRRILHSSASQKSATTAADQSKTNASAKISKLSTPSHDDQSEKKSASASSLKPPDIAKQFTSNLRNIADIISVSQEFMTSAIPPQTPLQPVPSAVLPQAPLQPVQAHQTGMETKGIVPADPPLPMNAGAWSDVEHLFEGFDDQQKAAIQRERTRRLEEQKKLFAARKLCLVLDLDHTLLNSAKFVDVNPLLDELLRKKEEQDREKPQRHLFQFPQMGMWTKLRPGIWNFLEKASKLFELHLYTMGNKYYATEMAKLLDPNGELFSGRVVSRGDDGEQLDREDRVPKSKDLEGVLGMESGVVIMDDSVRVWPHNKLNLIVVERYIYFPCSRRSFGLPGPSLLEIDHDERPEDGTLAASLSVIERIHENFFGHESLEEADVRNILACEQRKILGGCRIIFSRVIPMAETNPHTHPLWQTAEQFGAVCTNQMDDQVTHVVANSLGTDKVNWGLANGKFVVYPGWVEASSLLYRRARELDFAIKQ